MGKSRIQITPSQLQEALDRRHSKADQTSPFAAQHTGSANIVPFSDLSGLGYVGATKGRGDKQTWSTHLVRIDCQHWAPKARETGDCRFFCERA